jgi:hypothetical protein
MGPERFVCSVFVLYLFVINTCIASHYNKSFLLPLSSSVWCKAAMHQTSVFKIACKKNIFIVIGGAGKALVPGSAFYTLFKTAQTVQTMVEFRIQ